jgi:hypothetical protein
MRKFEPMIINKKILCVFIIPLILTLSACEKVSYFATLMSDDSKRVCEEAFSPPPPSKMDSCRILATLVITKGTDACKSAVDEIWESKQDKTNESIFGAFMEGFRKGYICNDLETTATKLKIYKKSWL